MDKQYDNENIELTEDINTESLDSVPGGTEAWEKAVDLDDLERRRREQEAKRRRPQGGGSGPRSGGPVVIERK